MVSGWILGPGGAFLSHILWTFILTHIPAAFKDESKAKDKCVKSTNKKSEQKSPKVCMKGAIDDWLIEQSRTQTSVTLLVFILRHHFSH